MRPWKLMLRYFAVLLLLVPIAASLTTRATDVGPARMVVETKSTFQTGDTMAFWFKGRVAGHSPNAHRMVFDGDLTSLATGDKAGTFTWDLTCYDAVGFPCWVYEVTNTFRLAGGTIVTRGTSTGPPMPPPPASSTSGSTRATSSKRAASTPAGPATPTCLAAMALRRCPPSLTLTTSG